MPPITPKTTKIHNNLHTKTQQPTVVIHQHPIPAVLHHRRSVQEKIHPVVSTTIIIVHNRDLSLVNHLQIRRVIQFVVNVVLLGMVVLLRMKRILFRKLIINVLNHQMIVLLVVVVIKNNLSII